MSPRASILIVGEDQMLSYTRAQILRDWETAITGSKDAPQAIRSRPYNLLIFCQTIPDSTAKEIVAQANQLYPGVKVLTITEEGWERHFGPITFTAEVFNPGRLHDAVVGILNSNGDGVH
jgi:DNA-binding NtrC family response regulator